MASVKKVRGSRIRGEENKENFIIDSVVESKEVRRIKSSKIRVRGKDIDEGNSSSIKRNSEVSSMKKIGSRKLRLERREEVEEKMDQKIEQEDNLSITVMILILVICFVVGIVLGYLLYRLAIDNTNVLHICSFSNLYKFLCQ